MHVAAPETQADTAGRVARTKRNGRRNNARAVTGIKRLRLCGLHVSPGQQGATLSMLDGRAMIGGVQTCGSIWACPCCSAKIRHVRSGQVEDAASRWIDEGRSMVFVTLTLRHYQGHALVDTLDAASDGWRSVVTGKTWKDLSERVGIAGYVRALEVTHGRHGWHPHVHALVFLERGASDDQLADLHGKIHARWAGHAQRAGLPVPSADHGVRVERVTTRGPQLARYLSKLQDGAGPADELLRGDLKTGRKQSRTPFELLDTVVSNPDDAALWREYEIATSGRKAITWSRRLRARLDVDDVDDAQVADNVEPEAELLMVFTDDEWLTVNWMRAHADICNAAEDGGEPAVRRLLAGLTRRRRHTRAPWWLARPPGS